MKKFIGYTVGLLASHKNFSAPKLVKIEFNRMVSGDVNLSVVSGHNLGPLHKCGSATVTSEEFSNRSDNNIEEARWAFEKVGLSF
jgi:hypothetical protein